MKIMYYALTLLCLTPVLLLAHGVNYSIVESAVGVQVVYADGTPMAYAEAEVWGPDSIEPFYDGESDQHGVFAFVPDRAGEWKVVLDDGMGHRVEATIYVDADLRVAGMAGRPPPGRLSAAVVGISLLFGAFGVWSLFVRRGTTVSCI